MMVKDEQSVEDLEEALCSQHSALEFYNTLAPGAEPVIRMVEVAAKDVVECVEKDVKRAKTSFFGKLKRKKSKF